MTRHSLGVALAVSALVVLAGCALTPPAHVVAPTIGAATETRAVVSGASCPEVALDVIVRWRPWSDGRVRVVSVWADYTDGSGTPIFTLTSPGDHVLFSGPSGRTVGDGRDYLLTDADEPVLDGTAGTSPVGWSPDHPAGWTVTDVPAGTRLYVDLAGCAAEWETP